MFEKYYQPTVLKLFVLLLLAMLLDGVTSFMMMGPLMHYPNMMAPKLMIMVLVMIVMLVPDVNFVLSGFIIGYLFDSYYSGFLGIYLFILPGVIYLLIKIREYMTTNALTIGAIFLIVLTFIELLVFSIYSVIQINTTGYLEFISRSLGPTVLLNLCVYIALYYPLRKLIERIKK